MRERTQGWLKAGLWLAGSYAALVGLAYASQRKLLYPAPQPPREPDRGHGELIRTSTPSGREVVALWVKGDLGRPTVVHFHGNGEQLADVGSLAGALGRAGCNVLAVEYPGYGLASGQEPSEGALYEAAEGALVYLRERLGVPVEKTTLMGQSLGSGVAAEMARRGRGARLVLLSPYTSIPEVAARVVPVLPGRLLVRDRFATAEKAPEIRVPTLIVHGEKDELIPVSMGRALGRRFPQVTVEVIAEAHHNDLFAPPHGADLVARIAAFAR